MQNGIFFSIISIFYSLLTAVLFFTKDKKATKENKIYSVLIITNIIGLLIEILPTTLAIRGVISVSQGVLMLFLKLILIYLVLWTLFFTYYVVIVSIQDEEKTKFLKTLGIMIGIFSSIMILILPLDYYINNGAAYSYGIAANFVYVVSGILILFCSILLFTHLKKINIKYYYPLIIFLVLGGVVMAIQYLHPELTLMLSLHAFITCIMYHTIENPDMQLINQLELAKNKADQANNAKSDFLSSMSHEIRTPLNAIVGLSENMQTETNMNVIHSNAKDVVDASYILLDIVNSILDISKIEAGKMEMVNTNYNLKSEVKKLVKLLETRIGEKDLKLVTNISDEIPNVLYGDVNKVKQIITNLVTNAIKYTDSGEVDFTIDAENEDDKCNLTITVKDTGRGIKEEQLKHLYEKFERLESDKNTTIEGTGLGLAITKQLVGMFKGTITVDSIYGKGSTFKVTLTQDIKEGVILEEHNETEQQKYDNVKVLVVDDSSLNLKVADTILRKYNIETELVTSGQESIEKCKTNKYDIVFMDIMMPSMSGEETLKKLKEIKDFNTPVVALTADAMEGKKEIYLSEGFIGYLSKPIQRPELEEVLGKILTNNTSNKSFQSTIKEDVKESEKPPIKTQSENTTSNNLSYLEENGIDTSVIDSMYANDINLYKSSVETYLNDIDELIKDLNKYNKDNLIDEYKSTLDKINGLCEFIGLTNLIEICNKHDISINEELIKEIKHSKEILTEWIKNNV